MSRLMICTVVVLCACDSETDNMEVGRVETKQARCSRVREHMIDLRLGSEAADAEQHRNALRAALGERFVVDCSIAYSDNALACAMRADTPATLDSCLYPDSSNVGAQQ